MKVVEVNLDNGGADLIYEIISLQQVHNDIESLKKQYKQTKLAGMSMAIVVLERQFNAQFLSRHEAVIKFCRKNGLDVNCDIKIDGNPGKGEFQLIFSPYEPEQEELI